MPDYSDKRLTPPDGPFVPFQVTAGVCAIRETPTPDGRLATQALHGEILHLYKEEGEFGYVQCARDGYVGWALMEALSAPVLQATHSVSALRTYCYAEADLKSAPRYMLCLGARVVVEETRGDWLRCARAGWVHKRCLSAVGGLLASDPVSVAEMYMHTPYLWGGRESLGLDCTGLTQQAFEAAGVLLPRDSDMQFKWVGEPIDNWQTPGALRRGDLVFWKGHVGIMMNPVDLLHANGNTMNVAVEPLSGAIERIGYLYGQPTLVRRP